MSRPLLVTLVLLARCGQPEATLQATVILPAAVSVSDVHAIDFIVLTATSATGQHVTCADAASAWQTGDNVLYHRFASSGALHFLSVPSGKALIVLVNAYSDSEGLGLPFATACQDNVSIAAGTTQTLTIALHGSR